MEENATTTIEGTEINESATVKQQIFILRVLIYSSFISCLLVQYSLIQFLFWFSFFGFNCFICFICLFGKAANYLYSTVNYVKQFITQFITQSL